MMLWGRNRRIGVVLALLVPALLFVCVSYVNAQGEPDSQNPALHLPAIVSGMPSASRAVSDYAQGEIAVGVRRDAVGAAAITEEIQAQAISEIDLSGLDGEDGDAGVDGYLMRVAPGQEWQTIDLLRSNSAVAFAEPNWVVRAAGVGDESAAGEVPFPVNDPLYADEQWYLQRVRASSRLGAE